MTTPKWQPIEEEAEKIEQAQFRPIYPATAKLTSEAIERVVSENLDAAIENESFGFVRTGHTARAFGGFEYRRPAKYGGSQAGQASSQYHNI